MREARRAGMIAASTPATIATAVNTTSSVTGICSPTPYFDVKSTPGAPLNLFIWNAPVSNDALTLEFSQLINANDALRTGAYSKALTFTLSTTTP